MSMKVRHMVLIDDALRSLIISNPESVMLANDFRIKANAVVKTLV